MIVFIINDARKRKVNGGGFLLTPGNFWESFRDRGQPLRKNGRVKRADQGGIVPF
jgi:hypothetical protein